MKVNIISWVTQMPHGLWHAKLLCPSLSPGTCSNSCPLSCWCYPTISSSVTLLLLPSIFPSIKVFSNELALCIRWPKYWSFSFSISPSNEYSGLIFLRIDWFDLLLAKGLSRVFSAETDNSIIGDGHGKKPLSFKEICWGFSLNNNWQVRGDCFLAYCHMRIWC